jgi:hypothetical protein
MGVPESALCTFCSDHKAHEGSRQNVPRRGVRKPSWIGELPGRTSGCTV